MSRVLRIVPGLAGADLRHEWILTLCLVIAVAAVVAPLLILMGLKHGTISTLRERLVEDPAYRELRPMQTQEYATAWFSKMAADPRVGFILPTILPASSIIQAITGNAAQPVLMDLLPSAEGDPLMLDNQVQPPTAGEVVLTAAAASKLQLKPGDELRLRATRRRRGRAEYGVQKMHVSGILPASAGSLPRIYAPLDFVLDVEHFKEGMAVPKRHWSGDLARPYASYDGVLVLAEHELDSLLRNALLIESGLADIQPTGPEQLEHLLGQRPSATWRAWLLSVPRGSITRSSYMAVKNRLRGRGAVVLPVVKPFELSLNGRMQKVIGLSLSQSRADKLGVQAPPWGGLKRNPESDDLLQLLLPADAVPVTAKPLTAVFRGHDRLVFPLNVQGISPGDYAVVPLELAAILRTARQRSVKFDAQSRAFIMQQSGYRGFRLYAASIDHVPALAADMEAEGVPVIAEIEAIRRIQVLDAGLTRLFWLIAVLGVGGGIAVLVASLYASVQRKSRELAMLRLIGLSRLDLFGFPVYEGLMIAAGGLLMSLAAYGLLATIINRVFADEMAESEKICELPLSYILAAVGITLGIALCSALFAAWKATRIDPADAIRAE